MLHTAKSGRPPQSFGVSCGTDSKRVGTTV
jgi:hypothetical protein